MRFAREACLQRRPSAHSSRFSTASDISIIKGSPIAISNRRIYFSTPEVRSNLETLARRPSSDYPGSIRFTSRADCVALSHTLLQSSLLNPVRLVLPSFCCILTMVDSYDARLVDIWACGIVYYCLHFQELPWGSAQASDRSYAHYAQQCLTPQLSVANIPFLKTATTGLNTPVTPGPGTPHRQDSSAVTPTLHALMSPLSPSGPSTPSGLAPQSRAEREKEVAKENAAAYPSTIYNLSPRACRPVLRRMLEPKPELRVTIEDILRHPWIQSIDMCTEPGAVAKHIHPAAIAAAAAGAQDK